MCGFTHGSTLFDDEMSLKTLYRVVRAVCFYGIVYAEAVLASWSTTHWFNLVRKLAWLCMLMITSNILKIASRLIINHHYKRVRQRQV